MPKTGFYCEYELKDTTAMEDSTPTSEYNQDFGNMLLLKENTDSGQYATLEQDFFILDGSREEMPDEVEDIAFFSNVMSGAAGTFADNPAMEISFTEKHSSIGITFYFQEDYPEEMTIIWYDISGIQIDRKDFEIGALKFFARNQVENYAGIKIVFTKAKPYRYVKLRYLEYGTDLIMGEGGMPVKGASLLEETNRISDKIPINKLSYKLIDVDDDFNIGNIAGLHKVLQKRQRMSAYEIVDGNRISLGTFFLDSFKTDKNVTNMSAVDYKGLLDDYRYLNGRVFDGETAQAVISEIMEAAGIEEYEIADEVKDIKLYGWLKIQTCRKALREVLFACGAVVDSRSGRLRIYKPGREIETVIERARKFSTSVYDQEYISDISVKFAEYALNSETSQIAKGTYAAGIYTLELSSPAAELEISGGTILRQSCNYVEFQVSESTEVVITGKKYVKEELTVTSSVTEKDAGKVRKTKSFSCTLVNMARALELAEELLDYYQLRIGLKIKFLNVLEIPGMWGEIQNNNREYGNYLAGIEKMTTDLTSGFISTAELRGYYKLVSDYYYTGELIAGEDMGVL